MALQVKLGSIILLLTINSLLVLCLPNDYSRNKKGASTIEETITSTSGISVQDDVVPIKQNWDDTTDDFFDRFNRDQVSTYETVRIIYIGVGVTFWVLVFIGIAICCVCFKRRRQQQRGFVFSSTAPAQQQQQIIFQQIPQQNLSEFPPPYNTQPAQGQQQFQHMSTLGNSQHSPQEQLYPPMQQQQPTGTLEFHNPTTTSPPEHDKF